VSSHPEQPVITRASDQHVIAAVSVDHVVSQATQMTSRPTVPTRRSSRGVPWSVHPAGCALDVTVTPPTISVPPGVRRTQRERSCTQGMRMRGSTPTAKAWSSCERGDSNSHGLAATES
jgi:hypothetical protein